MKINKYTFALVGMWIICLARAVHASNPVVYLTGSTALRRIIYAAATTPGQIFTSGGTVVSPSPYNVRSANAIVYEGTLSSGGGTIDLDCDFSGSEAGIAAVAGQPLTQIVNGGTYNVPGVPAAFLKQSDGWTNFATLPIDNGVSTPDLVIADNSMAISQTPISSYPLTDYGILGIMPITFLKGYAKTPDQAWNDLTNVTMMEVNQNLASGYGYNASDMTAVAADNSDGVAIVGRNKGSGTRANLLVQTIYAINTPLLQYGMGATYPAWTPGVLTFGGSYAAGQPIQGYGSDGFASDSLVQQELNVDGTGVGSVFIGYIGISDAQIAVNPRTAGAGQAATALPYNGVYESDQAVIQGAYPLWAQVHLFGSVQQIPSGIAGLTAQAIMSGIAAQLSSSNAGGATGDFSTSPTTQSALIPRSLMQVHRTAAGGSPIQGPF